MPERSDSGAFIAPGVRLGEGVRVGAFARIYNNVIVGEGCEIGDFVVLGHPSSHPEWKGQPLEIGSGSIIRSHSVLYEGSRFGPRLETGHHVVIREGTRAGENLRVGNFSDIEGSCLIGDYVRFHGYVHVGKGSQVGNFVWLFSLVTLTNDPLPPSHGFKPVVVEDGAVVAVGVTVLPGARLGKGSFVGAVGKVGGTIPPAALVVDGRVVSPVTRLANFDLGIAHPWMSHFADAYPQEAQTRLRLLGDEVRALAKNVIVNRAR